MSAENKEIVKNLRSGRKEVVLSTIEDLRKMGNVKLIPDLLNILDNSDDVDINSAILSFMNDLNEKECVAPFMEFLKKHTHSAYLGELVASCWQNGLDFSEYIKFFIDIVLEKNYAVSIEAFTVVEENIESVSMEERNRLIIYIEGEIDKITEEKIPLVNELISVVKTVSGPFRFDISELTN